MNEPISRRPGAGQMTPEKAHGPLRGEMPGPNRLAEHKGARQGVYGGLRELLRRPASRPRSPDAPQTERLAPSPLTRLGRRGDKRAEHGGAGRPNPQAQPMTIDAVQRRVQAWRTSMPPPSYPASGSPDAAKPPSPPPSAPSTDSDGAEQQQRGRSRARLGNAVRQTSAKPRRFGVMSDSPRRPELDARREADLLAALDALEVGRPQPTAAERAAGPPASP